MGCEVWALWLNWVGLRLLGYSERAVDTPRTLFFAIFLFRQPIPILTHLEIHRAKAEENAWLEVANFYNSYQRTVLSSLDKSLPAPPPTPSAKSKGKQRATSQEVEDWSSLREHELPEAFRGEDGVGLAKSVVNARETEEGRKSPLSERLEGLEFKVRFFLVHFFLFASDEVYDMGLTLCYIARVGRQSAFLFKLSTPNNKRSLR